MPKKITIIIEDTEPEFGYIQLPYEPIPDPCKDCPNDPRNGGNGMCVCSIPFMNQTTAVYN